MKILFQMSGSIACYKACDLISQLVQEGHEVKVAVTPSVLLFVGEATLEGLTGEPVYKNSFERGCMMSHIELSRWCDKAILCPASAQTINALSSGTKEGLLGDIFLAFPLKKKPYIVVPAMNSLMYHHASVKDSIEKLSSWGVQVLPTERGRLACKEIGDGRLLDKQKILAHLLEKSVIADRGINLLITGGGTEEKIDAVRTLSNVSTGRTAFFLSEKFQKEGCNVTFLKSKSSALSSPAIKEVLFSDFKDFEEKI